MCGYASEKRLRSREINKGGSAPARARARVCVCSSKRATTGVFRVLAYIRAAPELRARTVPGAYRTCRERATNGRYFRCQRPVFFFENLTSRVRFLARNRLAPCSILRCDTLSIPAAHRAFSSSPIPLSISSSERCPGVGTIGDQNGRAIGDRGKRSCRYYSSSFCRRRAILRR